MAIAKARQWILTVADKIGDPAYRTSYLEHVPENRRTLELARQWLGESVVDPSAGVMAPPSGSGPC